MSFSSGKTRHQFRPSGFRPPRPFAPSASGMPDNGPESPEAATPHPPAAGPLPSAFQPGPPLGNQPPANQSRPQHPHHRGPNPAPARQEQGRAQQGGGQRHDQRHGGGGGGGGGQGHGGNRHPQNQQQPRGQQRGGPQPGHQQRQQRPPQLPNRLPQPAQLRQPEAPLPPPPAAPLADQQNDLFPLSPLPGNAPAEALAPQQSQLPSPSDAAALAPFAEDIEIDESLVEKPAPRRQPTGREMLINVVEGEEVRIAVVRRSQLEELYMERSSTESHIGNIYKGRVTNVEPSIQAAFIDFGIGKNGFLHISDLHPQYFPKRHQPRMPQQRRQNPQQRARQTPPPPPAAAPQGFQPPHADQPDQSANPAPITLAHSSAGDAPGVSFEAPTLELPGQADAKNGAGNDTAINGGEPRENHAAPAQSAGDAPVESTPATQDSGREMAAAPGSGIHQVLDSLAEDPAAPDAPLAGPDNAPEEAPEEDEENAGEPADFGSAYNSEFADDDEFEADYDGDEEIDDGHMKPMEKVGRKTPRHERPPIQQCLRRGQEVIVQVTKEGIGTKGPTLTTYVSCPGRYLVMMPGMAQLGVSRKIEDLDQRRELKRTLQELNPPRNLGFIIRTAGTEVSKKELQGDLSYLVRMWKVIANRIRTHKAPVELYQESDLVIRTIRDVFTDEIDRIIVDNEQVASRVRDFLSIVDPRSAGLVELYTGTMPVFQKFGVEREIEKINSRRVELPNGGSLVIDSTEALVAIDVNSGRYREQRDAELTAFNMNKEALKEVVRQLRLRDLGGVIVIDFIDMREERHKREIERLLREEMKNDRAKTKVLRMSLFCMIEMTRQRVRPSLKRSIYMDCPHCHGSALIKTPESVSLDVMRRLAAGATRLDVARLEVKAYPTVATFLLNRKRKALTDLEEKSNKRINITPDDTLAGDQIVIQPYDARSSLLNIIL
jgi:Rne/Rng family ribonuclease